MLFSVKENSTPCCPKHQLSSLNGPRGFQTCLLRCHWALWVQCCPPAVTILHGTAVCPYRQLFSWPLGLLPHIPLFRFFSFLSWVGSNMISLYILNRVHSFYKIKDLRIWKTELQKERKRHEKNFICWLTVQMSVISRAWPDWSQQLHLYLWWGWKGSTHLDHLS